MISKEKISHIYKKYSAEIYKYLCRLTGNADSAEDILQEVFEKFIAYTAERDINEENYRAFLYKTGHNLCINHIIKLKRVHPGSIDDLEDTLKTEDCHLDRLILDDLNAKIYRVLETINPECRSIFIMHKEGGMNYDEIAESLSISARTVRRRVRDVLDILYNELKKEGFLS
jgi:RNA polymerase sigma-70 factor, ECF subfamily